MNFRCLKKIWPVIKKSWLHCFNEFEDNYELPKGFNSSFVALVPKVPHPKDVSNFRPISLINCTSKLLTKIWASRISCISGKLLDNH